MKSLKSLGKVYTTDILIVGGGISGLSAAISAKESAPETDILVVDKASASRGYAGKAARTAGLLSFVTNEDDPEDFVKFCLDNIGCYLNDQHLLREFAYDSRLIVEKLSLWGVEIPRDQEGRIRYAKWPFPWGTTSIDPDMCVQMSKYAKKLGVKFIDRVNVVDLLKRYDNVAGAAGFTLPDGSYNIFKAGSVILANGSQNYDVTPVWCSTGSGTAAAYRAGAEMRNAEFGNMCDFARVDPRGWFYYGIHGGAHTAHDHLHNSKGENISRKYRPGLHSSMDPIAALAWYRETLEGNGPIYADIGAFESEGEKFFQFHPKAIQRLQLAFSKANPSESKKFEVVPGFIGELSCVSVDHQMATSVPGLFAVGDISGSGSARGGAVPTPPAKIHGTGILNALFMGIKGGPAAAVHAGALKEAGIDPEPDHSHAEMIRDKVFAPLKRNTGTSPREIIHKIQDSLAPVDYSVIKSETRMQKALNQIMNLQKKLGSMKAGDSQELSKCMDAESMALCAEMFYRASLMRTESRGFHYREDFADTDNDNWLKWIVIKDTKGKMEAFTKDIPMDKYPYRP
ncbi:MAG: FAD-dependent oxidoreductase [Desulfobacteraceae bacterium]|nr:FAD-dependent oxidoreductase [Desulfobacteraceae bacterium]